MRLVGILPSLAALQVWGLEVRRKSPREIHAMDTGRDDMPRVHSGQGLPRVESRMGSNRACSD